MKCIIDMKLPSLNDYIRDCRTNRYLGAKRKKELEEQISLFICNLPRFENPIKIHFHWIEGNKRRDFDNVCFGKKFILDAMVKCGKLKDDNRKCVAGFIDTFSYGSNFSVVLEIEEINEV